MIRIVSILLFTLALSACSMNQYVIAENEPLPEASATQGYLGLGVTSIDRISSINITATATGEKIMIGPFSKGTEIFTMLLPEGEYCITSLSAYTRRFTYNDKGFCTYVEAEEVNYMGLLSVAYPVTRMYQDYGGYLININKMYPELCRKYIGKGCV